MSIWAALSLTSWFFRLKALDSYCQTYTRARKENPRFIVCLQWTEARLIKTIFRQYCNWLTHVRTLCLPMIKETFQLQGFTKLDQLESRMMKSPFWARNLTGECSKGGWPAYFKTAENKTKTDFKDIDHKAPFKLFLFFNKTPRNTRKVNIWTVSIFYWPTNFWSVITRSPVYKNVHQCILISTNIILF